MGFYWEGLPPYVLEWARDFLPEGTVAVETGTFRGDTSELLANYFGTCVTIERSADFVNKARARFAGDPRVTVIQGSSRDKLVEAMPTGQTPCFLWLDAHGIYNFEDSEAEENPILEELAVVTAARGQAPTVIAIDDARGLGTQPGWPTLGEVCAVLHQAGYATVVVDDCVIAVPNDLQPDFWTLYQKSRTVEVSALFHVWRSVKRSVRIRALLDVGFSKIKR